IYGNGMQTRSFCYVSDLVEGIYRLSRSRYHDPVNLGNPREMTLKELIVFIRTMTNSKSKIVYKPLPKDDPKQRQPDISRARVLLKWQPRVAVEEGLPTTIAWFRDRI
ncbi:MAG: GDP-mannose 4,6-dehydratase, partial [Candidatus Omnitrophica bacterium]|nr:GDP-mannose 4,6-dehydratase [Candidatus Omnitrophota bacterium]